MLETDLVALQTGSRGRQDLAACSVFVGVGGVVVVYHYNAGVLEGGDRGVTGGGG